jgi:transposase
VVLDQWHRLRRHRTDQANALAFDVRVALFALLGKDITTIDGLGPYLSLKLVAESSSA